MLTGVASRLWTAAVLVVLAAPERGMAGSPGITAPRAVAGECAAPEYRQFDFRLGAYSVTTRTGRPAGEALIESTLGGCMLVEYWTGAISGQGRAHYFYDRGHGLWRFVFVNDDGSSLIMAGGLVGSAMVFSGQNRFGEFDGLHRMTWSKLADGRVSQLWELSTDEGASWKTVHVGYYALRN
jgi:hypothetical protein